MKPYREDFLSGCRLAAVVLHKTTSRYIPVLAKEAWRETKDDSSSSSITASVTLRPFAKDNGSTVLALKANTPGTMRTKHLVAYEIAIGEPRFDGDVPPLHRVEVVDNLDVAKERALVWANGRAAILITALYSCTRPTEGWFWLYSDTNPGAGRWVHTDHPLQIKPTPRRP